MAQGIEIRHKRDCRARKGGGCPCNPGYRAQVYDSRRGKVIRKTFPTMAAARTWRRDAQTALAQGTMQAPSATTVAEAAEAWLTGAKAGLVSNRSGDPFKPSVVRSYERSLRTRVLPALGRLKLSELRRSDVQDFADRLRAEGLDPSTIKNTLMPIRVVCRRAVQRDELAVNPCADLDLPAVRGSRDRVADPVEGAALLAVVPDRDRALWATALYAGLRRGELQALRWEDVDLPNGLIHVRSTWDRVEGAIPPKSKAGVRKVPISAALRAPLAAHRLACPWSKGLVFGRSASDAFNPSTLGQRAKRAWKAAGLESIGLHECRHSFASMMIAAMANSGTFNPKVLQGFMGHASLTLTYDRYGHLFPGSEAEAGGMLDTYLSSATGTEGR
jgi:integrase